MVVKILKLFVCFLAKDSRLRIDSIVPDAVAEDEDDIVNEPFNFEVLVLFKFLFYGAEVHRSLNYLEIVWNLKLLRIDRRLENPG